VPEPRVLREPLCCSAGNNRRESKIGMKHISQNGVKAGMVMVRGVLFGSLVGLLVCLGSGVALAQESAVGPLLKLFQSGKLPPERQGTVVEMICNRGNSNDLRIVLDRAIDPMGFQPELRLKSLGWLVDAAKTRKQKPAGDLSAIGKLVGGEEAKRNPALQAAAIRLAATWKDEAVAPALAELALDKATAPDLQKAAIDGLVAIGNPSSQTALGKLVGPDYAIRVRMTAAGGLAGLDPAAAVKAAGEILASATPTDDPAPLLAPILDRKGGADLLAAALEAKQPPVDVAKRALRYMYSVGRNDAALTNALSAAAGLSGSTEPPSQEEVAAITAEVIAKGDAARGEAVFRRKELNCLKCHAVSRAGGQIGPELSAVGGSSPVDYVANAILNPNLAIKEQYVTRVFALADGRVLTGIVVDRDTERVRIKDVNGQVLILPTADIEEEEEGKSMMPAGLTMFLTKGELYDLIKYVSELGKAGPYAVQTAKTVQRWKRLVAPPQELKAEVPHLEHLRQYVLGADPSAWETVYGQVAGGLPLEELRVNDQPGVQILQGELLVTSPGKVRVMIESTERFQSWYDSSAREGESGYEILLEPGRHTLTLRVEVSDRPKPTLRVEFKVPQGGSANFEVVGGA
jgi:putative heme-binding domain-containing protein